MQEVDPTYFKRQAICAGAGIPLDRGATPIRGAAEQIVGLLPGEVFGYITKRGNLVVPRISTCLSVTTGYAIDVLKGQAHHEVGWTLWLRRGDRCFAEEARRHCRFLGAAVHRVINLPGLVDATPEHQRIDRLCRVCVLERMVSLCNTPVVQDAWAEAGSSTIHGWIYGLKDGLMHRRLPSISPAILCHATEPLLALEAKICLQPQ